ncbi:hypothetical protein Acsp04_64500 [Actinomadura sp. NBRC 104425]|uniref:hypothetical protein n=1 Tax=Actinomadura sp. NBRC 104425 TaxID=3032204 RepID=UPI0024A4D43B|nr:hypothetical protein [Actinomadura sp. NBRC 104425]GLZ16215.1 hypothetical protein Acsp04_64500 [Actinomadura sp. NBRC 104425]
MAVLPRRRIRGSPRTFIGGALRISREAPHPQPREAARIEPEELAELTTSPKSPAPHEPPEAPGADVAGTARTGARRTFLPDDFVVPTLVAGPRFRIRPITVHDVVKDYAAVRGSLERLRERFGPDWGWPAEEFTFDQALIDIAWLQKEGQLRRSFSYAVTTPDEECQLGRIHIAPSDTPDADAVVVFWVRDDQDDPSLERELEEFVREWVVTTWPFKTVRFPGRD